MSKVLDPLRSPRKSSFKDLSGQRFGCLTVVSFGDREVCPPNNVFKIRWLCKCDCGKEKLIRAESLRSKNTISCDCSRKETLSKIGKLKAKDPQEKGLGLQLSSYQRAAKNRNISWDLSDEQALVLFNSKCFYCGVFPTQRPTGAGKHYRFYKANGIDRIDNESGYTVGNTVPCCSVCNFAKNKMTVANFVEWQNRIYSNCMTVPLYLYRRVDVSGVSGTGVVAVGVILPSGKVVLEWLGPYKTETIFEDISQIFAIHSHGESTQIIIGNPGFHDLLEKRGALKIYKSGVRNPEILPKPPKESKK